MKKTLSVILTALLLAAVVSGCAGTGEPAESSTAQNSATLYGSWTKSDWDSASSEEKELAVIFLVEEAAASEGGDAEVVQSIVDDAEESLSAGAYSEIEDAISNYFDNAGDNATLQDALKDVRSTISKYVALG